MRVGKGALVDEMTDPTADNAALTEEKTDNAEERLPTEAALATDASLEKDAASDD